MGRAKVAEQHTFDIIDSNGILLAAATLTSGVQMARGYAEVFGHALADQAGTLYVEQGRDGIFWDVVDTLAVAADTAVRWNIPIKARYVRVRWVNGAVNQGSFRIYGAFIRIRSPNPAGISTGSGGTSSAGTPAGITVGTAVAGQAADVQLIAAAANLRFMGFACRESAAAAAAATFILRHGTLATSPVIAAVELLANESTRELYWPGLLTPNGVFLDIVAGTIDITPYRATV